MKSLLKTCAVLMALHCPGVVLAGGEGWTADYAAAQKTAAESGKDLLVDFTGSDWCSWCIKLNKEVFEHQPFKDGVKDKFVLVELDYPRDQAKLSAETIAQNEELGKKYQVAGYPTILLCDAKGVPFGVTGYQAGGPEEYVKHLDELRGQKKTRDEGLASASKLEGVAKAKALTAVLKSMSLTDGMVANFYGDVVEQIKASDPSDETGFAKEAALKERIAGLKTGLNGHIQKKDFEGAIGFIDAALQEGGLPDDDTQQLMMTRGMFFAQLKKFDDAIKAIDEAKAFAPDSPWAANMDKIKQRFEEEKAAAASPAEAKTPGE